MRARIVGFESGQLYADRRRRVRVRFETESTPLAQVVTLMDRDLGVVGLRLDDVLEVEFRCDEGAGSRRAGEAGSTVVAPPQPGRH